MANSKIEWTDAVWNPITGCSKVSKGCRNCYAERIFSRAAFEANAEPGIKKLLPISHREALDGLVVTFSEGKFGKVYYEADGEGWYLYPVYWEWCKESLTPEEVADYKSKLAKAQRRERAAVEELDNAQPCFACA